MTREEKIIELERMFKNCPEMLSPIKVSRWTPLGKNRVYELIKSKELKSFIYRDVGKRESEQKRSVPFPANDRATAYDSRRTENSSERYVHCNQDRLQSDQGKTEAFLQMGDPV